MVLANREASIRVGIGGKKATIILSSSHSLDDQQPSTLTNPILT